ncbi:heparinase II/III-family protein, partial [bacterium]|nr:heparinase II/III-family protein [bacterium]
QPDGVMPQMNDGFRAKNLRTLYRNPARMFDRRDFEFFASQGQSGREPEMRSVGFPYSGVYVMRSDWGPEARYMIVDAGLFGSSHGHEDKLSFELFAYGKPFIVEGGTYTYKYDRWHRYFESSFAHNTIIVDGRSQLRMANEATWAFQNPEKLPNVWHSNELFDYLEASYEDGYGNNKENVLRGLKHTRRILFVKPDYWIIWDVVSGEGEYPASQLFHFASEAQVHLENHKEVIAIYDNGPQLTLRSLSPQDVALTKVVGSESPIQGWVSPEYGVKVKTVAVEFETKGALPRTFVTVLFPSAETDGTPFEAELVAVFKEARPIETAEVIGLRVEFSHSRDLILMAPGTSSELRFENQKSNQQLYLKREKKNGQIVEMRVPH